VVSFIENEFEVILQELERNSNIYSNDIVTTIADELQEYNSRRSSEINGCCESIHHRMQLLNYDHNREIQSLSEDYNRKINLLHQSDSELLKRLYSDGKFNDKPEYNAPDYDWEYTKYKNSLKDSEVRFDRELEKYENELKKLEQERYSIKHVMHEYDQWKKCGFDVNYVFKDSSKEFMLLHFAANFGDTNVTKLLLEEGANIDIKDQNKNTPLHLAASNGHTDIVKLLVEKGSDLSAVNKDGGTPLQIAFYNNHTEIVKYLMEKEPRMKEVLEHLVRCVVESKTHKLLKGSTPLHLAAVYDCTEIVESLLEKGKNPLSKDIDGKTPRELATDENLVQIFRVAEIKQQEYDATKWVLLVVDQQQHLVQL
jgi:transcriptional regulator of NAD metabolism